MKRLKKINFKSKNAAIATVLVTTGLVVGGLGVSQSEAALDWLGLEQKLENHDQQLENHDDRIGNAEKDIEGLQENTNTAPSTDKVIVREVTTQNPTIEQQPESQQSQPAPTPTPVTVVSFEVIPTAIPGEYDCKHTYSDGTTKTFRWKWFSVETNSKGQQVKYGRSSGYCDAVAIGQLKP